MVVVDVPCSPATRDFGTANRTTTALLLENLLPPLKGQPMTLRYPCAVPFVVAIGAYRLTSALAIMSEIKVLFRLRLPARSANLEAVGSQLLRSEPSATATPDCPALAAFRSQHAALAIYVELAGRLPGPAHPAIFCAVYNAHR